MIRLFCAKFSFEKERRREKREEERRREKKREEERRREKKRKAHLTGSKVFGLNFD